MDARAVVERLKVALEVKTDVELSSKIEVPTETINSWKRRNSIPLDSVLKLSERDSLSLDWLFFGKGRTSLASPDGSELQTQVHEGVAALRLALSTMKLSEDQVEDLVALWLHWRAVISFTRKQVTGEYGLSDEEAVRLFLERWSANFELDKLRPVKLTA